MKLPYGIVGALLVCHVTALAQEQPRIVEAARIDAAVEDHGARPKMHAVTTPWTRPALMLAETIDLSSAEPGPAEAKRIVQGGKFVPGGWQATDSMDVLVLALKEGFTGVEPGAIELDMTNLDFNAQVTGRKQHFFNLYADPTGDQFNLRNAFFTLRAGNYKDAEGRRGIKVLWRGGGERGEKAPFATRETWDPKATYTWRAEWTDRELVVFLDGERIFGPAEFYARDPAAPMRYVFLSRDGIPKPVWYGLPGPVYKTIRVYRKAL